MSAQPVPGPTAKSGPVAAIDIGTNSVRLLVVGQDGETLWRASIITRLGEHVDRTRSLGAPAIARALDALARHRRSIDEFGATGIRAIATSACRDASNRDEFFDAAETVLGVRPELLSGEEEGLLSFAGATADRSRRQDAWGEDALDLVVDIGGGSTEFVVGVAGASPVGAWSIDTGCVRLTEQFLHHDPPTAEELSQAISVVGAYLDDVKREVPEVGSASRLIGCGGSIRAGAAVEIGFPASMGAEQRRLALHRFWLTRAAAEDVFRTLATESAADRRHNPGLAPERVGTVVGGMLVLVSVLRHFDLDGCEVSTTDLLDAVAAGLLA